MSTHKTSRELLEIIDNSPVQAGTMWRHYKGDIYKVVNLSVDCNTNEVVVHYQNVYNMDLSGVTFSRSIKEWLEAVDDGTQRFTPVRSVTLNLTDDALRKIIEYTNYPHKFEHIFRNL